MVNSLSTPEIGFANAIFNSGAVHFGRFSLHVHKGRRGPSGLPLSPLFIDLSELSLSVVAVIGLYLKTVAVSERLRFERVCGVPTGGNGFAKAFCRAESRNAFQLLALQKIPMNHGQSRIQGPIQGLYGPHDIVLPIEDVITTGESTIAAIDALGATGLKIHDAMAVIDYGLGATERLKAKGITLHAILPISSLLGLWLEGKKITTEQYDMIMAFLNEMKLKLPVVQ